MYSEISKDDVEYEWELINIVNSRLRLQIYRRNPFRSYKSCFTANFCHIGACAVPRTADITTADSTISTQEHDDSIQSQQRVLRAPIPFGYE
ncbi:hypothetical protein BHYA_0309g00010 [Botrytis hyacinthi]|uniref:Uncharacterized protein n=1 Tax=Botrytis hyacinthi TaxID=278943 RepID=A0A4Z1GEW2_9HELO|nr:hypothetical protein BHYA_0309g00010 [Botrytis hyacinthi]